MDDRRVLNNMTPGSNRAGLGDRILAIEEGTGIKIAADADSGLDAGTLVDVIHSLSARIKALEEA